MLWHDQPHMSIGILQKLQLACVLPMIAIPLPFVVALLLVVLIGFVLSQGERGGGAVIAFLGACVVLMLVVGLRWSSDIPFFRSLQPVIASLLPPFAWLCFASLERLRYRLILHFLPSFVILVSSLLWPIWHPPIDVMLAFLYFGYGGILVWRGIQGPDQLVRVRLSDAIQARQAVAVVGGLLLFSGLVDLGVSLDLSFAGGSHIGEIVGAGNLLLLPVIGWAIMLMQRSVPVEEDETETPRTMSEMAGTVLSDEETALDSERVMADVIDIMEGKKLYRDPDLTLDRLSRRLAIPARQVSMAINLQLGENVSRAINGWRIKEAQQLLEHTDQPITSIMFECGFQTKSNFNREFLRIAGISPSAWRRRAREREI